MFFRSSGLARIHIQIAISVFASHIFAQTKVPEPSVVNARISPTLYFPSNETEIATRQQLHAAVKPMVKEVSAARTQTLRLTLDRAFALETKLQRHAAYLKVRGLEDTQDQDIKTRRVAVNSDQAVLESAIRERLAKVSDADAHKLGPYLLLADEVRADASRSLTPDAQLYRTLVITPNQDAIASSYDSLLDSVLPYNDVSSRNAELRRAALDARNHAYDLIAPTAAAQLAAIVDSQNRDATAEGFKNAAERKYHGLGFTEEDVKSLIERVEAVAPVYRRYQETLSKHAAYVLNVPSVSSSELSLVQSDSQILSFDEGRAVILKALQPLGPDYVRRFRDLLDPANGRLDMVGGAHRAKTGTSIAVFDAPVAFYYSGYKGTPGDLDTIIHEGGHATHRELMNEGGAPVYEREGPHYLSEGFAVFNEFLLLDYAVRSARTTVEKRTALEAFLAELAHEFFVSAEEAKFEGSLYNASSGKALLDRAQVDALYGEAIQPFEYWKPSDVGASRLWMRKRLLVEDPLYLVNYLYGSLVALSLFQHSQSDPHFAARYESLLRHGFNADPQAMLKSIDIDLSDPSIVTGIAKLFDDKTHELNAIYQAEGSNP